MPVGYGHWGRWSHGSPDSGFPYALTNSALTDGVDEALSGGASVYGSGGAMTIAGWWKTPAVLPDAAVAGKTDWSGTRDCFEILSFAGNIYASFFDGGSRCGYISPALSTNTWYHIALTWNGQLNPLTEIRGYFNGTLGTVSGGEQLTTTPTTTNPFYIGAFNSSGSPGVFCPGHFTDWAIWSSALSATEVAYLHTTKPFDLRSNRGDYVSSSTLVNFWTIGEGADSTATDGITDWKGSRPLTALNMEAGDFVAVIPS